MYIAHMCVCMCLIFVANIWTRYLFTQRILNELSLQKLKTKIYLFCWLKMNQNFSFYIKIIDM